MDKYTQTHRPIPEVSESFKARFARLHSGGDGCWVWKRPTNFTPRVNLDDHSFKASRVAFYIGHGKDPGDKLVCHTCDNPLCVRPDHLFLGTTQENTADRSRKGRTRPGSGHGELNKNAKLTAADVLSIRQSKLASRALANKYNVTISAIQKIISFRTWGHLR
ncbi:MAG: hypothetical protein F2743_08480 [Actinobacteria bacterium]|nr:hypothetical protein [Actinomycetota bacterium]